MPNSSSDSSPPTPHAPATAAAGSRFFGILVGSLALVALGFVLGTVFSDVKAEGEPTRVALDAPVRNAAGTLADTKPAATTAPAPAPAAARGAPPVLVEPPIIQMGLLKPGESASGTAHLRNIGDEPLQILASRASCRCTSVNLALTWIQPGESVPLTARYDASASLGQKTESVRVRFAGYSELLEVPVKAEVAMAVRAVPSYLRAVEALTGTITIESVDGRPFSILATHGEPPQFVGFIANVDPPRNRYFLKWDLTRYGTNCVDAQGNPMPWWWVVETDHPDCRVFDLQVRHQCTFPRRPDDGRKWVLSQRRIALGEIKAGESSEFTVALRWLRRREPDATIRRIVSESEYLAVQLLDVTRNNDLIECRVRVTVSAEHRGMLYGTLRFYSALHNAPLVVTGLVVE